MSARLPGDPNLALKLVYTLGVRLSPRYTEWVRHDLTDADWRWRLVLRHVLVLLPICLALLALPGPWSLRIMTAALLWISSTFVMVLYTGPIRDHKLRQHRLEPPEQQTR
ncbi:MAG TPA: DUF5313 family protein [Streptosporangiales bacterium]